MYRLSSNFTLVFKIFIPIFWATVFGLFTAAFFVSSSESLGLFNSLAYKIGFTVFYLVFLTIIFLTLWKLKRVETDDEFLYVTNYFKNVKIGIGNIEKMNKVSLGFTSLVTLKLKNKSSFGKKIYFLAKSSNFDAFLEKHEAYFENL